MPDYLPPSARSKLVDYGLFLDPTGMTPPDTTAEARISEIRKTLPNFSINHADHDFLCGRPLWLAVETKIPSGFEMNAMLQMRVWLASHWHLLETLVTLQARQQASVDVTDISAVINNALEQLPFLPGLIVVGDVWQFVGMTRQKNVLTLWKGMQIGSTAAWAGVLQIETALRQLGAWAIQTFWPWFKRYALGITTHTALAP